MAESFAELFEQYLTDKEISPKTFAKLSGMPLAEVQALLKGDLPITYLRANHLAAVFDTDVDMWISHNTNHGTDRKLLRQDGPH